MPVKIDETRDSLLTDFGKQTLVDRYLLENESIQQMFARVSTKYSNDENHAQRLYDYISKLWFMPSTPVLSNGGANRGLPISCFLNSVEDSIEGIAGVWNENIYLAKNGGGLGTYWGKVRSVNESISKSGKSSGVIPFIHVMDSITLAINQGSLRRGSAAAYIRIDHPEIEEFLSIRKSSGDFNRKALNIHHGIAITDKFMDCVDSDLPFELVSPKDGNVVRTINARELFQRILETRLATGEPYLLFIDTVNKNLPEVHQKLGLKVETSNLCSEILLPTGKDHLGAQRTAVCCLSSLNLEKIDEWKNNYQFIEDIMYFLDNVLSDFIENAPVEAANAIYAATRERSVGLGVMGLHSYFQSKNIPFGCLSAEIENKIIFKKIKELVDKASVSIAKVRGACPDAQSLGIEERFVYKMAIAPTASISIICGGTSACVEPIPANIYTHKTLSGSFSVRNPYLNKIFMEHHNNDIEKVEDEWMGVLYNEGSVSGVSWMSEEQKEVFKTSHEIDQRWILKLAGDRSKFIDQGQSINLFLTPDINKWDLLMLHIDAYKRGIKSLYYCRSKSIQRTEKAGFSGDTIMTNPTELTKYEECLACQ